MQAKCGARIPKGVTHVQGNVASRSAQDERAAAAGVAGASLLGGCAPKAASSASDSGKAANGGSTAATTAAGHERAGLPSFLSAPEPIKDVKTTKDYDVVIVGAGAAGIPAAITAKEAGASVAVIQKESTAISQGNTATGILLDKSDPAGVEAVVSKLISEHDYRAKREQVELWAKNSGEAITWLFNLAQQCGAQVSDTTKKWTSGIAKVNDYEMNYLSIDFGPKPYNTGEGMKALAEYAEKQGVDFFYSTEAKQLVGDARTSRALSPRAPRATFNSTRKRALSWLPAIIKTTTRW